MEGKDKEGGGESGAKGGRGDERGRRGGEERAEEEVVAKEGARMAMAKEEGERGRDEG